MRTRKEIENEIETVTRFPADVLTIEILLDIRDLLSEPTDES
jgi:hypothetical protein